MIRRGESGWVDVRRAFMVARWWGCDHVAPQVSTGNRTAGDHRHLSVLPTLLRS